MYDYVLQYGFDVESQNYIQGIKDYLKNNGIKDRERKYIPHATLCTSETLDKSIQLANKKFNSFTATIKHIWIYNRDMDLIKECSLR